jgi:hypothetical protein
VFALLLLAAKTTFSGGQLVMVIMLIVAALIFLSGALGFPGGSTTSTGRFAGFYGAPRLVCAGLTLLTCGILAFVWP